MSDGSRAPSDAGDVPADHTGDDSAAHVLLLLDGAEDRRLLDEWLSQRYTVTATADTAALDDAFDLCVVDEPLFRRARDAVLDRTADADGPFVPLLLLVHRDAMDALGRADWQAVDEVLAVPTRRAELHARIENLLERRHTSERLVARNDELEAAVEELQQGKRAMDRAPIGITISDPHAEDNPLIYVNEAFEQLTGYSESEAIGRNCRFLQGPATDASTVAEVRRAIDAEHPVSVDIVNYTKSGRRYWCRLEVAPVHDADGRLVNYVGFQTEITQRKISEQRLQVQNRLLTHNLRNELNKVEGYAGLVDDAVDDPQVNAATTEIREAAESLLGLSENVREIEQAFRRDEGFSAVVDLRAVLEDVVERCAEEYPDATVTLDVPDGEWYTSGGGVRVAVAEAVDNALKHNTADDPRVDISLHPVPDSREFAVDVVDNGPGIPPDELEVLRQGEETSLRHGDRLGLWMTHWILNGLGGDLMISSDAGGTAVTLLVPKVPADDAA